MNLAIFEFIDAALFKPLLANRPDELASLYHRSDKDAEAITTTSYPEYEFYRSHNTVFSDMLAFLRVPMNIGAGPEAQRISGEFVSPNYFAVMGLRPAVGRLPGPDEPDTSVVIGYSLWQDSFGADPKVVGRQIRIGDGDFTIAGVARQPAAFAASSWIGATRPRCGFQYRDTEKPRPFSRTSTSFTNGAWNRI